MEQIHKVKQSYSPLFLLVQNPARWTDNQEKVAIWNRRKENQVLKRNFG